MLNIGGTVKQVIMVVFSVYYFQNELTAIGFIGVVITMAGSMWYFYEENRKNKEYVLIKDECKI